MSVENNIEQIRYPLIAAELQEMFDVDQDMRERSLPNDYWDDTVDQKHTKRMKEIVAEIGWPTISKVGKTGSSNAWLLVQHADHDVDFQEHCLQLMKELPAGEIDIVNVPYLTDRVCVRRGRGQLYGTQFTEIDGRLVPQVIEEEADVDMRRSELGMGPLSEQIQMMHKKYPPEEEK